MRPAIFLGILVAAGCVAAGCSNSHNETPLIPDSRSPVSDVPVPAGFTMMSDSTSKVVTADQMRVVDHRYHGGDGVLPVANFYRDELPQRQWTLVDQTQPNGKEVTLHFQKSKEDCTVTVTKHTFDTQIHVQIEPIAKSAGQ